MLRFHNIPELRKETGFAFVWILILLVVTSALSLAFLQKTGIGTSAAASRGLAMQAHYLARAAANHALWRLLNEPHFTASETVYYMHDLGNGRYGYKLRKPTLTKFGTVATVGGVSDVVTNQSYVQYLKPYNIITTYDEDGVGIPKYRRLLGATWVDPADTVDDGPDNSSYIVLKGCPIRKEVIMGTLDTAMDINFAVWDGTTWGNLTEFTQNTVEHYYMSFDIAYENQSGDALVVGRYDDTGVRYNIWNGSAWAFGTPQEDASLSPGDDLTYLTMASKPNSDKILIAAVQDSKDLKVIQWDGASFNDQGEIDDDMATYDYGSAEIVYEQQSGDALILWSHKSSSEIYYSVWSGASLSPVDQLPDFGGIPYVIRAAADPTSDQIFVAAVDKSYDLNVAVWNGDEWIDSREISTGVHDWLGQVFDVAWEHSGEDVLVAWTTGEADNKIRYFSWRKGTALADNDAAKIGPHFVTNPFRVRLHAISSTEKIILLVKNNGDELRYCLWTGNKFLGDPAILLESSLALGRLPFDVAESGVT